MINLYDTIAYIIVGSTGQATVIYDSLFRRTQDLGEPHKILALYDHSMPLPRTPIPGVEVTHQLLLVAQVEGWLKQYADVNFYLAMGYPNAPGEVREALGAELRGLGLHPANVMHPSAYVSSRTLYWGYGTQVMAGVIIQPNVVMGNYVLVNTGATIDHDCMIGDGVEIAPGVTICGNVIIDKYAIIFAGATIGPGVRIGEGAVVRAGALVLGNVLAGAEVQSKGMPARTLGDKKLLRGTWGK